MARIVLNETSYHGAGCIAEIPGELNRRGLKKAFVCSDPDLVKFGVTKKVLDILDEAKIPYELYSEIKPNPTIENVQTGVAAFKASGADSLVAIGGGSSMDTAKAIGIFGRRSAHEEPLRTHYRSAYDGRYGSGSYDQLRNHRRAEKEKVRLCRRTRHSRRSSG